MPVKHFRDFVSEDLAKKTSYTINHHDSPGSSRVLHSKTLQVANKTELRGHVRKYMDERGLDPDDEDDHSYITVTAKK